MLRLIIHYVLGNGKVKNESGDKVKKNAILLQWFLESVLYTVTMKNKAKLKCLLEMMLQWM